MPFTGVLARRSGRGKSRAAMAGVEFDLNDTPDGEQSGVLRHIGVRVAK